MKTKRLLGAVLVIAVGIVAIFLLSRKNDPRDFAGQTLPPDVREQIRAQVSKPHQTNQSNQQDFRAGPQSFTKRWGDMTIEEQAKLASNFTNRYKPMVEKWFKAYEGRIPFQLEQFTFDTFHSRFGDHLYTFMIDDTTFTIQDNNQFGLKVFYLMTKEAAKELNRVPSSGFIPDLNVPITREEVIRMVKADAGVEFKPNEVLIKPTGAACALNGGAFVHLLPLGKDPNNGANIQLALIFSQNGKMVTYERDPFF